MKSFTKKMLEYIGPFKITFLGAFSFVVVIEAFSMATPFLNGKIFDSIVSGKPVKNTLVLVGILALFYIINDIIELIKDRFENKRINYDFSAHISRKTLEKFFAFSIGQHVNQNSGIKQRVVKRGEGDLDNLASSFVHEMMPTIASTILITLALLVIVPPIGLVAVIFDVLFIYISIYTNKKIRPDLDKYKDQESEEGKFYGEMYRNVDLIQVNVQEERIKKEYSTLLESMYDFGKSIWQRYLNISYIRSAMMSVAQISVLLIGIFMVYKKVYTPGYLIFIMGWTSRSFGNLWRVGWLHRRATDQISSVKKYFDLLAIEPDINEIKNPKILNNLEGRVEFKNVVFCYPKTKYENADGTEDTEPKQTKNTPDALAGVSFTIESGQKVAFVGHSGAGKSTLTHLLLRAYDPTGGQILIDGEDLKTLRLNSYRRQVGLVEQSVSLFDNTLKYNILFGLDKHDQDKVEEAALVKVARLACIDKFFDRLERGFDTIIGEKGIKLSGGERQRVGVARALIKEPKILIFDEATSSLDTENEALIHEAIEHASEGRTTIIIAHRLSTIRDADRIFVLDKGKLVGQGTHEELMKTCDQYKHLINRQVVSVD